MPPPPELTSGPAPTSNWRIVKIINERGELIDVLLESTSKSDDQIRREWEDRHRIKPPGGGSPIRKATGRWWKGIELEHDEDSYDTPTISFSESHLPDFFVDADTIADENEAHAEADKQRNKTGPVQKSGSGTPKPGKSTITLDPCDRLYIGAHLLQAGNRSQWGIDSDILSPNWNAETSGKNVNADTNLWPGGLPKQGMPGYDVYIEAWQSFQDMKERYNLWHRYLINHSLEETIDAILDGKLNTNADNNEKATELSIKWLLVLVVMLAAFTGESEAGLLVAAGKAIAEGDIHLILDKIKDWFSEEKFKVWLENSFKSKEDLDQFLTDLVEISYTNLVHAWLNMWVQANKSSTLFQNENPCGGKQQEFLNELDARARRARGRLPRPPGTEYHHEEQGGTQRA